MKDPKESERRLNKLLTGGPRRALMLSSVSSGRNPHLLGLSNALFEVERRFNLDPLVQGVLRSHPSGELMATILVTDECPQYMTKYSTFGVPRVPFVLVWVHESPFRGMSDDAMLQYVMRAIAMAIFVHGLKRKVNHQSLSDWFARLPGRDRFEPVPYEGKSGAD